MYDRPEFVSPAVFRQLKQRLDGGSVIVFAGAGVSAPLVPTWKALTEILLEEALANGRDEARLAEVRELLRLNQLLSRPLC